MGYLLPSKKEERKEEEENKLNGTIILFRILKLEIYYYGINYNDPFQLEVCFLDPFHIRVYV